jgi:hypothetical protein
MPGMRLSYLRRLLTGPHVAATPVGPIGGGVALEPSHLDLSVAHHYHELAEAGAYFIGLPWLEPSQVEPFSMSVVRQRGYSNSQKETQCTNTVQRCPAAQAVLYISWPISSSIHGNSNIDASNNSSNLENCMWPAGGRDDRVREAGRGTAESNGWAGRVHRRRYRAVRVDPDGA